MSDKQPQLASETQPSFWSFHLDSPGLEEDLVPVGYVTPTDDEDPETAPPHVN